MRAGLIHDCGYQMIREGHIPKRYKEYFDKLFYQILIEDGMNRFRAYYYYFAVKTWGHYALKPKE
jgi:hypothetical protein